MFEEGYYLSKDLDRITFITASVAAFMVGVSWIIHGCNKCCGEDTDWRPACYGLCPRSIVHCGSSYDSDEDCGGCKTD
jgi:hypothetical protein